MDTSWSSRSPGLQSTCTARAACGVQDTGCFLKPRCRCHVICSPSCSPSGPPPHPCELGSESPEGEPLGPSACELGSGSPEEGSSGRASHCRLRSMFAPRAQPRRLTLSCSVSASRPSAASPTSPDKKAKRHQVKSDPTPFGLRGRVAHLLDEA
ncbi:hypothetical protein Celaphus_00016840 [Cervus elaphus hippelaphus]|uniref:Uncharacterized protein n=1 Tax=Cervus elaphus hippelaphus TaxID=46360 RepID=A0A212C3U2_CEREH|nr:hypothetical protein Celaphus_00016840 [Cervus elaphus hippelaphus]